MLTIILGDYGSGKTETAKHLANQNGGIHLRCEMLVRGNVPIADKLKSIMKQEKNYYLDGWNGNYHFADLPGILGTEVKYVVCMAAPERIHKAQINKKATTIVLPRPVDLIRITTQHSAAIALTYDDNPIFADTTSYPVTFWNKEQWLSRWMEINLYGQLNGRGEYQDVELNGFTIKGLSRSYLTWERLESLIDFKGKSVIDYGCNLGYFCFKAESAGAIGITGVDVSHTVLATTRSIAMVKNSKAHFVVAELKDYQPGKVDIIMALNTLHHLKNDTDVLKRIFRNAREVVLELPEYDLLLMDMVAKLFGFGYPVVSSSHRQGRVIAVYSHLEKQPVVLKKYTYHPKREAARWWLISNASRCFPLWIKKYLRRRIR